MIKKILIFLFTLFILSYTSAFIFNLPDIIYYDEIIDVGVKDYNVDFDTVIIKIYDNYEIYFEQNYPISEINQIPIILDSKISSDSKINYVFLNNNDVILEKTFDLNLVYFEDDFLPIFQLCKKQKCSDSENFFWKDDSIFITLKDDCNFIYDISIKSNNNNIIFFDNNISFPYEINNYFISDNEDYTIVIGYSNLDHFFQIELDFTYFNYLEEDYFEYIEEVILDNILIEAGIFDNDLIDINGTNNDDISKEISIKSNLKTSTQNNNCLLFVSFIIILIVAISFLFKKKDRRKLREK